MGRPREFDKDEVLDKAMLCFWEKGYEGASVSVLEKATGISRISLYNSFKGKEQLFIAVQNKYHAVAEAYLNQIFDENAEYSNLEQFVSMIATKTEGDSSMERGCMMVNTVLNVDSIGQNVVDNVKKYREMMVGKFSAFLQRMQEHGKIRSDIDIDDSAAYLLGSMWGAMAINRLYGDSNSSQAQINVVLNTIESWKV